MVLCRKNRPHKLRFQPSTTIHMIPQSCSTQALLESQALTSGGYLQFNSSYPHLCESKSNELPSQDCPLPGPQNSATPSLSSSISQPALSSMHNQGPTKVLSYLYVGSQADALDKDVLERLGVTHILNVSSSCPQTPHIPESHFLRISVNDGYIDKLLPHFQIAFQFLEKVRESSGRCLVHCLAGISRSPTLAIAYIMKHLKMSHEEAYKFVKEKRANISPNFNFLGQLLEFEKQLKRTESATNLESEHPEAKRQRMVHSASSTFLRPHTLLSSVQSPTTALSRLSFTPCNSGAAKEEPKRARALSDFPTTSLDQLKCTPCLASSLPPVPPERTTSKRQHPSQNAPPVVPSHRPKSVAVSSFRAALIEQALFAYASESTTEKVRKCQSESHLADFMAGAGEKSHSLEDIGAPSAPFVLGERISNSTSNSSSHEILQVS